MIRLIVIWNVVMTVGLAVLLVGNHHGESSRTQLQAGVSQPDVLRVRRIEIVDKEGRLTAVLGEDPQGIKGGLSLFDANGRRAVMLGISDRGFGGLYFQAKHTEAKVTVGYFTENDEVVPLSKEDPEGMWGIRVLRPNLAAPQVFGVQMDGRPIPTSP